MASMDQVFATIGPALMDGPPAADSPETPASVYDGPSKRCTSCGLTKARTEYHLRRRSPDGLCYECKACGAARAKDYAQRKARERRELATNPNGKPCAECREFKGWDDFDVSYMQPDGRQRTCKLCQAEKRREQEIRATEISRVPDGTETHVSRLELLPPSAGAAPATDTYTLQEWIELAQVPSIFVAGSVACWLIGEKLARICTLDGHGAPSPVAVELVPWAVALLLERPADSIRGHVYY